MVLINGWYSLTRREDVLHAYVLSDRGEHDHELAEGVLVPDLAAVEQLARPG